MKKTLILLAGLAACASLASAADTLTLSTDNNVINISGNTVYQEVTVDTEVTKTPSTVTLNFSSVDDCLTGTDKLNFGAAVKEADGCITLNVDANSYSSADSTHLSTLLSTTNYYGIWNFKDAHSITLNVTGLSSDSFTTTSVTYTANTIGNDANSIASGSVGLLMTNDNTVQLVLKGKTSPTPEPATATLSLLALAGLAARRRRK